MRVVPYTVPKDFGLDLGPHISIVPAQEWDKLDEQAKQFLKEFKDKEYQRSIPAPLHRPQLFCWGAGKMCICFNRTLENKIIANNVTMGYYNH
jgi:hypothetical protein